MTLITHVIMQSKSKVGTRNVRVKIERRVGVVLSVDFNAVQFYKSSNGIEDEVDYFQNVNDNLPSLAVQRLQPVRKPIVMFDEFDKFDEVDKYCQFCEVKRSDDTGFCSKCWFKSR